jgi:undecaprenyl-diphosphatase
MLERRGVRLLAISPDEPALSRRLVSEPTLPFPVLSDSSAHVATRLGALQHGDVVPSAFVLDYRARLRWSLRGRGPADQPSMGRVMAELSIPRRLSVAAPSDVLTPVVAALVCLAAALLAVLAAVADHELLSWDVPIRDGLVGPDSGWSSSAVRRASSFGSRWVIGALSVPMIVLAWRRCRQLAVVVVAAFLVALGLELLLKAAIDRPRPAGATGFGSSFPSGHVLAAVAFWGLVPPWIYIVVRRRWAWVVAAITACTVVALVGVSRVAVGAHWPSDVVGSYLGGAMFLLAAEWVLRRPWRRFDCPPCQLHAFSGPVALKHQALSGRAAGGSTT